jgi:hypothetical protein
LEDETLTGIDILETQAGYIYLPEFEPGSSYSPFSSQLSFLGTAIPYWYYVSGNNIPREQVPTVNEMEEQLATFVEEKIKGCDFGNYYDVGFEIYLGEPNANTRVQDNSVRTSLNLEMTITRGDETVTINNHETLVNSFLGSLYSSAKTLHDYEHESLFLENYALETLRYYAPVDGVELSCSPLTWNANEVFDELQEFTEINTLAMKTKGSNFDSSLKHEYFIVDLNLDADVNFINSMRWPSTIEVSPSEDSLLIASPIGNQQGLGILGFCYTPYHFVYDLKYPVLIQLTRGEETFQFPMAVVIEGNNPRESLNATAVALDIPNFCGQSNTPTEVRTFDTNLNSVDANISFQCSTSVCNFGSTEQGSLNANFPQCVNGVVIAKANGFREQKEIYSVVESGTVNIFLDRAYERDVELVLDNGIYNGNAIITFASEQGTKTIVYPEQKTVSLSEGQYEVIAQLFRNASLTIPATTSEKCIDVARSGFAGFLGFTTERCYTVESPSQIVSNALHGGGKQNYYILESELSGNNLIRINTESFPLPNSIEALQRNYLLLEEKGLDIRFT